MNTPPKRPSWPKIINALMRTGLSQRQIKTMTGVSQPFLSALRCGKRASIGFDAGLRLYVLYTKTILRKELVLVELAKKQNTR